LTPGSPRVDPGLTPASPQLHISCTPASPQLHPSFTPDSLQVHPQAHPDSSRVDRGWCQRLKLQYDEPVFKLCVQFQLAPLHVGRGFRGALRAISRPRCQKQVSSRVGAQFRGRGGLKTSTRPTLNVILIRILPLLLLVVVLLLLILLLLLFFSSSSCMRIHPEGTTW